MMAEIVIPGECEAKLSAREGGPTFCFHRHKTSWVPFPHIDACAPMFAGNDKVAKPAFKEERHALELR